MARRWWTLIAVGLATFMTYLDNNVTNVAIPTIQRSLHLSIAGLEWVVSSYVLVFAGLLLAGGRIADVYGRRRLFFTGTVVFTLASLAAGLAGSGGVLIGARVVQGLGAALLVPTTLAIIMATFKDAKERPAAIGIWTAIGAMALAFGPLIGGFISQHLHWGWIFFINLPVGIVALAIAGFTMDESRDTAARRSLDVPGIATSSIALLSLTYALIEGHDKGWTSPVILAAFALAALAAALPAPDTARADTSKAAAPAEDPLVTQGRQLFTTKGCLGCHALSAVGAPTTAGRHDILRARPGVTADVPQTDSPPTAPLTRSERSGPARHRAPPSRAG